MLISAHTGRQQLQRSQALRFGDVKIASNDAFRFQDSDTRRRGLENLAAIFGDLKARKMYNSEGKQVEALLPCSRRGVDYILEQLESHAREGADSFILTVKTNQDRENDPIVSIILGDSRFEPLLGKVELDAVSPNTKKHLFFRLFNGESCDPGDCPS